MMDTLPTTSTAAKRGGGGGGRSKVAQTSKPSLLLAFFSCVAWLYVAGRFSFRSDSTHSNFILLNFCYSFSIHHDLKYCKRILSFLSLLGYGKMLRIELYLLVFSRRIQHRFTSYFQFQIPFSLLSIYLSIYHLLIYGI
jgi:hypothetical protein